MEDLRDRIHRVEALKGHRIQNLRRRFNSIVLTGSGRKDDLRRLRRKKQLELNAEKQRLAELEKERLELELAALESQSQSQYNLEENQDVNNPEDEGIRIPFSSDEEDVNNPEKEGVRIPFSSDEEDEVVEVPSVQPDVVEVPAPHVHHDVIDLVSSEDEGVRIPFSDDEDMELWPKINQTTEKHAKTKPKEEGTSSGWISRRTASASTSDSSHAEALARMTRTPLTTRKRPGKSGFPLRYRRRRKKKPKTAAIPTSSLPRLTCNDPQPSLEDRNVSLQKFCDYGRRDPNNPNPFHHVPNHIFPAVLSKKYDGHMALVHLSDDSVVLAEMCSVGGFLQIPTDLSARGDRSNLRYYVFDVLRHRGCEVANKSYLDRLRYAEEIVQDTGLTVREQRSRKRASSGNVEQVSLRDMPFRASTAEYVQVNSREAAWKTSKDWARDRTPHEQAIEGGVLTANAPITASSRRYKLKPYYDGEITIDKLNRGGTTRTHNRVTSVSGIDRSNGIRVTVKGNVGSLTVGQTITFRRHYCVSGESKGEFSGCKSETTFHRVRNDDAYSTTTPNEDARKTAAEARARARDQQHVEAGQPNRDIIGRWLECEHRHVPFDDCPFDDKDQASVIRNHVEDVEYDCRNVPMAVLQYVRLPESHPLRKKLDNGFVAKYKGSQDTYVLSVTYDRAKTTKSGKASTAWDAAYTWPKVSCTCRSWRFGNHDCTVKLQNKGRTPTVTRAGQLRLCKHWIDAIRRPTDNPNLTYEVKEQRKKSGASSSSSRSSSGSSSRRSSSSYEKPKNQRLTSAAELYEKLEDDDPVKRALAHGTIAVRGSTGDYIVRRFGKSPEDTKGMECSCPSYQKGKHGGRRNGKYPYEGAHKLHRLCKHTDALFRPEKRAGLEWHANMAEL